MASVKIRRLTYEVAYVDVEFPYYYVQNDDSGLDSFVVYGRFAADGAHHSVARRGPAGSGAYEYRARTSSVLNDLGDLLPDGRLRCRAATEGEFLSAVAVARASLGPPL